MKVIVIGAGEVGTSIAEALSQENEVVLIEEDKERCKSLQGLEVVLVEGNGASLRTLREAGAQDADLVIACTDVDEVNIVACAAARQLGAKFTIARVQDAEYLEVWKRGYLGVEHMVCSELLTAEAIARIIGIPEAKDTDEFADGRILMTELKIKEDSPIAGLKVSEAKVPATCKIVSIIRDGEVIVPRGDDVIRPEDKIVTLGIPEDLKEFVARLSKSEALKDIVIIGGGRIGYRLAKILEGRGLRPKIIEADEERSRWLAENLPNSLILRSDGTDLEFLEQERIGSADVVISVMTSDERNLLSSLLVKRLGVKEVIARVENTNYVQLFEMVGIDVAVNPRKVIAEEILRFTRSHLLALAMIEQDKAEILEIEAKAGEAVGKRLQKANFPPGTIVGAIVRDDKVIIPGGQDSIRPGDRVIIFSKRDKVKEVEKLL